MHEAIQNAVKYRIQNIIYFCIKYSFSIHSYRQNLIFNNIKKKKKMNLKYFIALQHTKKWFTPNNLNLFQKYTYGFNQERDYPYSK